MIDLTRSPIPLYFQIASDLEQQIGSGKFVPDEQLPNEKALAQQYGVSLVTVRSAMRVLFDKGLIVRYAGKGTFVAKRDKVQNVWSIGSLDELVATGLKSTMRLLAQRKVYPPDYVLEKLSLPPGGMAHMVRTVRESDGEPFMVTDQFHPLDLSRSLKKKDFTSSSARFRLVVQIVAENLGVKIDSVRQTMTAETAAKDIAELLGLQAGDPLLVVERDYFSEDGRLIQTGKAHYRTDKYRYVINISQVDEGAGGRNVYHLPLQRGAVSDAS
jgi:DNA-binding GntR family transcriptional regulator